MQRCERWTPLCVNGAQAFWFLEARVACLGGTADAAHPHNMRRAVELRQAPRGPDDAQTPPPPPPHVNVALSELHAHITQRCA
jgi:hypothetical protein